MCGFVFTSYEGTKQKEFDKGFQKIYHRGPDNESVTIQRGGVWGFHRLAIMDLSNRGNQPFMHNGSELMCNGEIFNYQELEKLVKDIYEFHSESDCEVLLPLYEKFGIEIMVKMLDAEFAMVLYDGKTGEVMAARDPIGIRPLFYGFEKETGKISFSSEAKGLIDFCRGVKPFPPGHYYKDGEFHSYNDIADPKVVVDEETETITKKIKDKLEAAVIKRLHSDAPIGFLLSGGLDSSLVCAIAQKHLKKPIKTFAIGMETDPIDLKYAGEVAEYLGTEHTEVRIAKDDVLGALRDVIYHLES